MECENGTGRVVPYGGAMQDVHPGEWYSFGEWVRRRRKVLDLTQGELADLIGCAKTTIVKIESDERRPSREMAQLLAGRLQIPAEQQGAFVKAGRGERSTANLPGPAEDPPAPLAPPG